MPKYKVDTDQGSFMVELDQPPSDLNQLRDLVGKHLASGVPNQSAVADNMAADVKRAQETGGSLMTRQKEQQGIQPQSVATAPKSGGWFSNLPTKEEIFAANAPAVTPGLHEPVQKIMETFNAPFQYISQKIADYAGEPARKSLQEDFGMSPDASAAIATGLTLPARALTEVVAPAKTIQGMGTLAGKTERALGNKLARTNDVAFQRRQTAIEEIQKAPEALKPSVSSDQLYKELKSENPIVPLKELKPVLDEIRKDEKLVSGTGLTHPKTESIVDSMTQKYFTGGQKVERLPGKGVVNVTNEPAKAEAPFEEVRALMKRLNERIGNLKAAGGEEFGDAMQIKRGLIQSLEKASENQVGDQWEKLRAANQAFKQELAYEKVGEIITKNIRTLEGRPEAGAQNIRAGNALDQLKKLMKDDPDLFKALPKDAMKNIEMGLERVRSLPLFGAPPGVDAGSKNVLRGLFMSGATGGTIGSALGGAVAGPIGAGIGGGLGTAITYKTGEAIARSLSRPGGIKLIEQMMKATNGQEFSPQQMAILSGFLKASGGQ